LSYAGYGRVLARYPETVDLVPVLRARVNLVAFGLVMVAMPLMMVAFPPSGNLAFTDVQQWVGGVGLLLFGPATAYLAVRSTRRRAALRLTADGLTDDSSLTAVGFVPWSEVAGVSLERISRATMIGVRLRDPETFIASLSWFRRISARTNLRMFGVPVWINPAGLPDAEEVVAQIEVYRRSWADRPRYALVQDAS